MVELGKKHNFDLVFDSQKTFRLILDAMANPGKPVSLLGSAEKMFGDFSVFLAIAMTLLDNEVSFAVCPAGGLLDEISLLTLAKPIDVSKADLVFVCQASQLEEVVAKAKCGTLVDPQKSATLVIDDPGEQNCSLMFRGPGIDGQLLVLVSPLVKKALILRDAQCHEYPQGIDLMWVNKAGELFALPRLVKWEVA